jgi:hypothetical protein
MYLFMYVCKDPVGVYNLNLADTFERAVFFDVLDCVAMDDSLSIEKLIYDVSGAKDNGSGTSVTNAADGSSGEALVLNKFVAPRVDEMLGPVELEEINHLEQLQSMMSDEKVIASLIRKFEVWGAFYHVLDYVSSSLKHFIFSLSSTLDV